MTDESCKLLACHKKVAVTPTAGLGDLYNEACAVVASFKETAAAAQDFLPKKGGKLKK